jgi:hypothetical protein
MKRQIVKMIPVVLAAAAIALAGASVARADQTLETKAKVPFEFMVNGVRLPAGEYSVKAISDDGEVLEIVSTDGRHRAITETITWTEDTEPNAPQLVFEQFGGTHFLSRVLPAGGTDREIVLTPELMEHEIMESRGRAAN